MRKKKYNLENRKHFVYFAIIYTCICVTVMAFTVFFQYRAYTKNYNITVAKLCALIHEKYPDVSDGSIAAILNDSSLGSDYTNLKSAETLLKKYGIDMEKDSAVLSNEKALKGALSDCRQSPRLFAEDFSVLKRLKVSIFKTFQSLFGIIKVSKKAVLFYDDTRNRKSKKANADGMY